jgi:hypothetical protein
MHVRVFEVVSARCAEFTNTCGVLVVSVLDVVEIDQGVRLTVVVQLRLELGQTPFLIAITWGTQFRGTEVAAAPVSSVWEKQGAAVSWVVWSAGFSGSARRTNARFVCAVPRSFWPCASNAIVTTIDLVVWTNTCLANQAETIVTDAFCFSYVRMRCTRARDTRSSTVYKFGVWADTFAIRGGIEGRIALAHIVFFIPNFVEGTWSHAYSSVIVIIRS